MVVIRRVKKRKYYHFVVSWVSVMSSRAQHADRDRLEFLTAVTLKVTFSQDVTLCRAVKVFFFDVSEKTLTSIFLF